MNQAPPKPPGRVTLVLGTVAGGTGTHVRMLAEGLAEQGITVSVAGPSSADSRFSFSALPSVLFCAVEIGERPRAGDLRVISRLRRLLGRPCDAPRAVHGHAGPEAVTAEQAGPEGTASGGAGPSRGPGDRARHASPGADAPSGQGHVVHAHGLRAGALTVLALLGSRRRPAVLVTVHNAPPPGGGAAGIVYRVLERIVARGADVVLCVSPDLQARLRAAGARRVAPAVVAAPDVPLAGPDAAGSGPAASFAGAGTRAPEPDVTAVSGMAQAAVAGLIAGEGRPEGTAEETPAARPVVLAIGRLAAQKGFSALLEAAATWLDLDPRPLVVIAGGGRLGPELRARAAALGVDVAFTGHVGDVPARLAMAAVFVLPSQWEGQPLVLQEALRAGVPVVATRVGGVQALAGDDAALLVPPGDTGALAAAVRAVLTDPALAARLRAAATARAACLPAPDDAVGAALASYAAVIR